MLQERVKRRSLLSHTPLSSERGMRLVPRSDYVSLLETQRYPPFPSHGTIVHRELIRAIQKSARILE